MDIELQKAVLFNDLRTLQACIERGADVNAVDAHGTSPLHLASFYGYHPIVHALIDARARVDARDHEWFTPLQRACLLDHPNTVKILINRGAKPNNTTKQFMTPLHICAQVNAVECAEVIISHCDSIIDRPDWGGCPALHYAAFYGNLAFVNLLLRGNANPNIRNKRGMTAVHWAALNGHCDVLQLLVSGGADLRVRDQRIRTVLHYAAMSGDVDSVKFVLENTSINVNALCSKGYTPLHYAVLNGRHRIAEMLMRCGASPIIPCYDHGFIPLHIAAGFAEGTLCCDFLLEATGNNGIRAADGSTALHLACKYGRIARTKSILAQGVLVNVTAKQRVTPLHMASRYGHELIVKHLLAAGADCNLRTRSGHTALHFAAFHGYVIVVRVLCTNGADVAAEDNVGRTALHVATQSASSNSEFVIEYLLNFANILASKLDARGCSALHYASRSGFFHAIQKLLAAGVRADGQDCYGCTPLHYAAQSAPDLALVSTKVLLRADDTVAQVRDKSGFLPIHYAVKAGNLETAQLLADAMPYFTVPSSEYPYHLTLYHIAARYNHSKLLHKLLALYHSRSMMFGKEQALKIANTIGLEMDSYERIPMHYAMSHGYERCVGILLQTAIRERALTQKDIFGMTSLHAAAACGRTVCVTLAVEILKENEINSLDSLERTPIMMAISNGFLDCFLALLSKSDVKLFDKNNRGLMHRACSLRNEILCRELIKKGADFKSVDCNGVTPFHIAAKSGDSATVNYLLANGVEEKTDSAGLTPFDWAAVEGNDSILHILYDANSQADRSMATILTASLGRTEACEFLLRMNPGYSKVVDVYGRTALHHAARQGQVKIARALISAGADLSAVDALRITPLMAAASCVDSLGALEITGLLIERDRRLLEMRDADGNTVFHHACLAGNEYVASFLLKYVNPIVSDQHAAHIVNAQNNHKETILHLACKAGMIMLIHGVLLISPYSLTLMDNRGRIPVTSPVDNDRVADCMLYMLDILIGTAGKNEFLARSRQFRGREDHRVHSTLAPQGADIEGDFY